MFRDTDTEQITTLVQRQDTFLERANRIPQMLDNWEASVMDRLDQAKDMDPVDRNFALMNFHRNELAVLGQYATKASIRMIGVVGSTHSFNVGLDGNMGVSYKPEVEFFPEKMALDNINKDAKEKGEIFGDEFDEFVVILLDQAGNKLKPPVNLTEMVIKQALDRMDARVPGDQLVDIRNVTRNLELPEDQQGKGYTLNQKEKEIYDLLLPIAVKNERTSTGAGEKTRLPQSIGSALRYVWNKSAYYFLSDLPTTDDIELPDKVLKAPNALEASIAHIYAESELSPGSVNRRDIPKEHVEWYLNSLSSDVSSGPINVTTCYQQERFKNRELVKLYDYPGLDDFL